MVSVSPGLSHGRRLAAALASLGVRKNDVVSVLAPNVPATYEMHFAVPMAAAVLNAINTRLDAKAVAVILRHAHAKVLFVDYDYVRLANDALQVVADAGAPVPLVAVIDDIDRPTGVRLGVGELEYEALVSGGDPAAELPSFADEWDAVTLNYTSGTTSAPKGVVYSHRGAYLNTMGHLLSWGWAPSCYTSGHSPCNTAMGGHSPREWRRAAASTSASARTAPLRSTAPSPATASPTCAAPPWYSISSWKARPGGLAP